MDFTREPIIETVITPKEGCKLVVRSSKNSGQEEYFVDSVEVVSFGNSFFFRSLERPKSFLVPSSDYEILEVREARMVLKNVGLDRSIKIGGGKDTSSKPPKEIQAEKVEVEEPALEEAVAAQGTADVGSGSELRVDKKRDRRRHYRRRRGREESTAKETSENEQSESVEAKIELQAPQEVAEGTLTEQVAPPSVIISSILPPPPTLISETIARYKDNAMFKGAFFVKEESEKIEEPHLEETLIADLPEEGNSGNSPQEQDEPSEESPDEFTSEEAPEEPSEPILYPDLDDLTEDPFNIPNEPAEDRISNGNQN